MHAIVARMRLPFFKTFVNFVNFCPIFQIFCLFLSFFLPFLWKLARTPLLSRIGPALYIPLDLNFHLISFKICEKCELISTTLYFYNYILTLFYFIFNFIFYNVVVLRKGKRNFQNLLFYLGTGPAWVMPKIKSNFSTEIRRDHQLSITSHLIKI